jgi:hypothetical protein
MNHASNKFVLSAVAMAASALLAACGGGEANPPPDTTPPTLAISDDVAAATASGPVTFAFTFSEDVGSSFTAEDITVTGGTAGTLTKVNATNYTLVVTPAANSASTIVVTVAAAKYSDLSSNANTAATTAEQAYSTVTQTQMSLPVNFDSATVDYGLIGFGGAEASAVVEDPTDAANKVARVIRAAGAETYAGTTITGAAELGFSPAIPLNANDTRMSVRVWSPDAGIPVRLKIEDHADNGKSVETEASTTVAGQWETLTFNFRNQAAGTAALNLSYTYDKATIFFDFNRPQAQAVEKTYYFDDIQVVTGQPEVPPPSGEPTTLANFDAVSPPVAGFEGAEGSAIEAGPAGGMGSGNAFKVLRSGGQPYALGIIETTVPVTADRRTVQAQVYSPTAGIPMVLKLEGPGANTGDTPANETVVQGWQTLTWTFAVDPALTYNKIVLLPNLGTVDAPPGMSYFFDDLVLLAAAGGTGGGTGGGGTGGGTGGVLTFSSGFAANNVTVEGGGFGGYSGSNLDGYNCNGAPENCGGGGSFVPDVAAADSGFYYYYQTATPAAELYTGIFVQAPGVNGTLSGTSDTPGIQISGQTDIKFTLGQNAEWFSTTTKNFMVVMDLGKLYPGPCRIQLRRVVAPTAAAPSAYSVPLSSFAVVQNCNVAGLTTAQALALSPIAQVAFQANGGGISLSDGNLSSGANLTVPNGEGRYPTTLVVNGAITFE